MDRNEIRDAVIKIVRGLLGRLQKEVPDIGDDSCLLDINGLDSQTWPYMMSELEVELGIEIPDNVNIFQNSAGKKLTLQEIVDLLGKFDKGSSS